MTDMHSFRIYTTFSMGPGRVEASVHPLRSWDLLPPPGGSTLAVQGFGQRIGGNRCDELFCALRCCLRCRYVLFCRRLSLHSNVLCMAQLSCLAFLFMGSMTPQLPLFRNPSDFSGGCLFPLSILDVLHLGLPRHGAVTCWT